MTICDISAPQNKSLTIRLEKQTVAQTKDKEPFKLQI